MSERAQNYSGNCVIDFVQFASCLFFVKGAFKELEEHLKLYRFHELMKTFTFICQKKHLYNRKNCLQIIFILRERMKN